MDWGTLRGRDGNCGALKKLAVMCMQLHVDRRLPNYTLSTSEIPPKDLFPKPDSLVCVYDYPGQKEQSDPQQMLRADEYGTSSQTGRWDRWSCWGRSASQDGGPEMRSRSRGTWNMPLPMPTPHTRGTCCSSRASARSVNCCYINRGRSWCCVF